MTGSPIVSVWTSTRPRITSSMTTERPAGTLSRRAVGLSRYRRAFFGGRGVAVRAAVDVRPLRRLGRLAVGVELLLGHSVRVGVPGLQKLDRRLLVRVQPLGLEIRGERSADLRPLVPLDAEPAESVQDRWSAPSTFRSVSVSSIRNTNVPPRRRVSNQLNRAVRTPPMCR